MSQKQPLPQPIARPPVGTLCPARMAAVAAVGLVALLGHSEVGAHAQAPPLSADGWATVVGLAAGTPKKPVTAPTPRHQDTRHVRRLAKPSEAPARLLVTSSLPERKGPLPERSGSVPEDRPNGAATAKSTDAPALALAPAPISVAAPASQLKLDATGAEYCRNLMPVAAEARAAFLQRTIASLEQDLARTTAQLEARIAEHKEWIDKRQRLVALADGKLLGMYAVMRPDAAGQRVAAMDELLAASLLLKLDARVSSALLSEVAPDKAARLTAIMAVPAGVKPPLAPALPALQSDRPEPGKKQP